MEKKTKEKGFFLKALDALERAGNKFPDPIYIFIGLAVVIVLLSFVLSQIGVEAVNPGTGETIVVENLMTKEYFGKMINDAAKIFTSYPPLGMVLVVMLGIGVAEGTGYFEKLIGYTIQKAPTKMIIPVMILVAIISNAFGDAGPIVLPPLAAIIFLKMGLHPIAGMCMVYATVLGAFAANLMPGMSDVLVFQFTEPAAQIIDPNIPLNALMNYYFIVASTPVLLIAIYFISVKIVIPRFGEYHGKVKLQEDIESPETEKAVKAANLSVLVILAIIFALTIPSWGPLRNQETGSAMTNSPLMNGIGLIIAIAFLVPGVVYGLKSGAIKSSKDLSILFTKSMGSMAGYIVIVFFAAQMLAYFNWSNLGVIMAIKGAELLENSSGVVLIIGVIILTSFINIFMGSASAKWALLAPIFVPMFMLLGFHPAFTQMIYRIADGITNPITPIMAYLPLMLAMAKDYDEETGFGTLIAGMMPYSIGIGIAWTALIIIWYLLQLPLGPESPVMLGFLTIIGG